MSDTEQIQKRPRITDVEPNERMVEGLLVKKLEFREQWLVHALHLKDKTSLASIEEAIARLAEKADIEFYIPGGDVNLSRQEMKNAINAIINFARNDKLLEDIPKTQSVMPKIGVENNLPLMDQLKTISPRAQHIFQLLGVQLQLAILIFDTPIETTEESTNQE